MALIWNLIFCFVIDLNIVKSEQRNRKVMRNLALYKPANQSSTYHVHNMVASNAVDGIRQYHWPFCTHTKFEYSPFWYVDLGGQYDIFKVEIVNRANRGERLRDISVVVAQERGIYDQTCDHFKGPGIPLVRIKCPVGTRGRFVKVQMATYPKMFLALCEVEVYGY